MNKIFVVQILGQEYQFKVDAENQDAQAIVDYLKNKVEEVQTRVKNMADHKIIMLAALNIASDLHELKREFEVYRNVTSRKSMELIDIIDLQIG